MELDEFVKNVLEDTFALKGEDIEWLEDNFPKWNKVYWVDDNTYWRVTFESLMEKYGTDRGYLDLILTLAMFRPSKDKDDTVKFRDEARRIPRALTILKQSRWW